MIVIIKKEILYLQKYCNQLLHNVTVFFINQLVSIIHFVFFAHFCFLRLSFSYSDKFNLVSSMVYAFKIQRSFWSNGFIHLLSSVSCWHIPKSIKTMIWWLVTGGITNNGIWSDSVSIFYNFLYKLKTVYKETPYYIYNNNI